MRYKTKFQWKGMTEKNNLSSPFFSVDHTMFVFVCLFGFVYFGLIWLDLVGGREFF